MIRPFKGLRPSTPKDITLLQRINNFSNDITRESFEHFAQMSNFIEELQAQFIQDEEPCYYIYRLGSQFDFQIGLIALIELNNPSCPIYPHENTNSDLSEKYLKLLRIKNAQANPLILLHNFFKPINILLKKLTSSIPDIDITLGCNHKIWVIKSRDSIHMINESYKLINKYYIADGHHRYYAAKRNIRGHLKSYVLSWLISDCQACHIPYHWIISNSKLIDSEYFLGTLNRFFKVSKKLIPVQTKIDNQFGLYINRTWYLLEINRSKLIAPSIIFMHHILKTKFGIEEISSIQVNLEELAKLTDQLFANAAITLPIISIGALLQSINAGYIYPKNTTCFVPKPAIGIITYNLDENCNNNIVSPILYNIKVALSPIISN